MIPKRSSETIQKILSTRSITAASNSTYGRANFRRTAASSISSVTGLTTGTAATMVQRQKQQRIRRERSYYTKGIDDGHRQHQKRTFSYPALHSVIPRPPSTTTPHCNKQKASFHTESEYHQAADDTLNTIQDTLEYYFEDNISNSSNSNFEINFASGVLTIALVPDHGTWVLNKQTPNRQIWWSSPLSGPRRYEYDESSGKWVWTKYIDYCNAQNGNGGSDGSWTENSTSLGEALKIEMTQLFQIEDGLEDLSDL